MDVGIILLGISFILLFGFLAELLFKKLHVPDVLFLIALGFAIGPYGFDLVRPENVAILAPIFTTFALLFLLYEGAFNIDLTSFAKGVGKSLGITLYNFLLSGIVVTGVMLLFKNDLLFSILVGCILGGVSSAFVIPLIKQLNLKGETYSVLAMESAFTDVLCIVGALTVLEIIKLQLFDAQMMVSKIISVFAVAIAIGIVAGIIWILLVESIFKRQKSYMITIAYLIIIYVLTEFLNGSGAIAALFFGLVLKNSRQLTQIARNIVDGKDGERDGVCVTTDEEEFFYSQLSFLLKTFFFVYIGMLISLENTTALFIGGIISVALLATRLASYAVTSSFSKGDRNLISAIFARGLAAAAIAQVVALSGIPGGEMITAITYAVITFTIILSSVRVFIVKRAISNEPESVETATPSTKKSQ